ncbi:MAG: O-antigen ligase family protein [Bacteroidota bacterium]
MTLPLKGLINKDNLYFFLLCAFVATIPFQENLADDMMFLTLIVWFFKYFSGETRFKRSPLAISIALMLLSIAVSFILNIQRILSEDIVNQIQRTLSLSSAFIWFFIVSTVPITEKKVKYIGGTFFIAFFSAISYLLITYFKNPITSGKRLTISNYNINFYGTLLALLVLSLIVFILFQKKKSSLICSVFLLILASLALIFTYSRGAWISLIGGLIAISFLLNRKTKAKLLLTLVVILIVCIVIMATNPLFLSRIYTIFSKDYNSNALRIDLWKTSFKMIPISPVYGIGPYMFHSYFKVINPEHFNIEFVHHACNNYLTVLVEEGLLGLIVYITFIIVAAMKIFQLKKSANQLLQYFSIVLLGWLLVVKIYGMFEYTLGISAFNLFMFLLGLSVSLENNQSINDPKVVNAKNRN